MTYIWKNQAKKLFPNVSWLYIKFLPLLFYFILFSLLIDWFNNLSFFICSFIYFIKNDFDNLFRNFLRNVCSSYSIKMPLAALMSTSSSRDYRCYSMETNSKSWNFFLKYMILTVGSWRIFLSFHLVKIIAFYVLFYLERYLTRYVWWMNIICF